MKAVPWPVCGHSDRSQDHSMPDSGQLHDARVRCSYPMEGSISHLYGKHLVGLA